MLIKVYWDKRSGQVLIPTVAKTEAGYWLNTEPVEHASLADQASVSKAIQNVVARGTKIVPTPSRQNFPKPVILAHSKTKSLSAFEKKYDQASIVYAPESTSSIDRYKRADEGPGWVVDSEQSIKFTPGISLEDMILRLSEIMQSDGHPAPEKC
jgi:hypothetical protein